VDEDSGERADLPRGEASPAGAPAYVRVAPGRGLCAHKYCAACRSSSLSSEHTSPASSEAPAASLRSATASRRQRSHDAFSKRCRGTYTTEGERNTLLFPDQTWRGPQSVHAPLVPSVCTAEDMKPVDGNRNFTSGAVNPGPGVDVYSRVCTTCVQSAYVQRTSRRVLSTACILYARRFPQYSRFARVCAQTDTYSRAAGERSRSASTPCGPPQTCKIATAAALTAGMSGVSPAGRCDLERDWRRCCRVESR